VLALTSLLLRRLTTSRLASIRISPLLPNAALMVS
jgi:hypothetical protein